MMTMMIMITVVLKVSNEVDIGENHVIITMIMMMIKMIIIMIQ